jgi:hypothetical protein
MNLRQYGAILVLSAATAMTLKSSESQIRETPKAQYVTTQYLGERLSPPELEKVVSTRVLPQYGSFWALPYNGNGQCAVASVAGAVEYARSKAQGIRLNVNSLLSKLNTVYFGSQLYQVRGINELSKFIPASERGIQLPKLATGIEEYLIDRNVPVSVRKKDLPSMDDLKHGTVGDSIGVITIVKYNPQGKEDDAIDGHTVMLVGQYESGGTQYLIIKDPAHNSLGKDRHRQVKVKQLEKELVKVERFFPEPFLGIVGSMIVFSPKK